LFHPLGGVDHFDDARPVVGESVVNGFSAEGFVHFHIGGRGPGRGHAVGGIEAGERADAVDAGVGPFLESFPAAANRRTSKAKMARLANLT